jgi:hypothetical protein
VNGDLIEEFAMLLHESAREAVARNLLLNRDEFARVFVEWPDLPDHAKEGRREQARYLVAHAREVARLLSR